VRVTAFEDIEGAVSEQTEAHLDALTGKAMEEAVKISEE
jgi:hypothetical protein